MGIIEAVKKGFAESGKLLKVIIIFFVLNVVMGLISIPIAQPENVGNPNIAAVSFVLSVLFFLVFIFLQGGALGLVRDLLKAGASKIENFKSYGQKYYLRILGLLVLYILIALVLVLVLGLIGSGVLTLADNIVTRAIVGTIAVVVALIAIVALLFPIYSIVCDEIGVVAALKKGIKLGIDNFWRVLGLFAILVAISVVISFVVGFILGIVTVVLPTIVTQVIITVVNSAVQSYIPIVMMIALMGFYLGLNKAALESPKEPAA